MKTCVFSFWYQNKKPALSSLELLCIKSWLDNDYIFELYTYNLDDEILHSLSKLYENFILKDASEILPFKMLFYDNRRGKSGRGMASFADLFRYKKLHEGGGIWVDMDLLCLNKKDTSAEYIFVNEPRTYFRETRQDIITNSFIKTPANTAFTKALYERALTLIKKQESQIEFASIGPVFIDSLVREFKLDEFIITVPQNSHLALIDKKGINSYPDAFYLHFGTEGFREFRMKREVRYPENSLFEQLKRKYKLSEFLKQLSYKNSLFEKISNALYHYYHHSKIKTYLRNRRTELRAARKEHKNA